jgi:hypothetical protein
MRDRRCGTDEITPKCAFRLASHSPKISLPSAVAFYTIVVELRNGDSRRHFATPGFSYASRSFRPKQRLDFWAISVIRSHNTPSEFLLSSLWCHPRGSILIAAFCRLAKSLSYSEQMGWLVGAVGIEIASLLSSLSTRSANACGSRIEMATIKADTHSTTWLRTLGLQLHWLARLL